MEIDATMDDCEELVVHIRKLGEALESLYYVFPSVVDGGCAFW